MLRGSAFTGGALTAALWQIRGERKYRHLAERQRATDVRRHQATKISGWIVRPHSFPMWIAVMNQSSEPVYMHLSFQSKEQVHRETRQMPRRSSSIELP